MADGDIVLREVAEAIGTETSNLEFSDEEDKQKTVAVYITVPKWSHLTWKNNRELREGKHIIMSEDIPGGIGDGDIFAIKADDIDVYYVNTK